MVHTDRFFRLPLTVVEHRYARSYQSVDRDQLEYCERAADLQRHLYQLRLHRLPRRTPIFCAI